MYRTDSELLASLGPAPLLEFGGGDTTSSFSLSFSIAAFTLSPLSASRQLLSPPHPPPPLYIYSFICWWLIPHYRDRSTDKRNVLGNTQCAPPFSRLSRSFLAIGNRREEGRLRARTRTRRHQEQKRIFSAQPFLSSLLFSVSLGSFFCSRCRRRLYWESKYHRDPLSCLERKRDRLP